MTTLANHWYELGKDRGQSIASWVDIPENLVDCAEYCGACEGDRPRVHCWMANQASEGESNDRQFSPFEFTAHEINEMDASEEIWEAYDSGINDGIDKNINQRLTQSGLF